MAEIVYHHIGMDPDYKVWHTIERNMIIYMYSDGGSIVCNEKTLPIKSGAICFIGSDKYHYTMPEEPDVYDRSKLFISDGDFISLLSLLPIGEEFNKKFTTESLVYAQLSGEDKTEVERIIADIDKYRNSKNFSAVLLSSYMRLLVYIEENRTDGVSENTGFLMPAIEYVNAHISENIRIDDICAAVHISKYHFCREFKRMTGQTFMEYILKTRIVLAKNMLSKSKLAIGEVSERCGFSSVSYFCRAFKNETRKTPLEFRRGRQKN